MWLLLLQPLGQELALLADLPGCSRINICIRARRPFESPSPARLLGQRFGPSSFEWSEIRGQSLFHAPISKGRFCLAQVVEDTTIILFCRRRRVKHPRI